MGVGYIRCTDLIYVALNELVDRRGSNFPVKITRVTLCNSIRTIKPTKPNYCFVLTVEINSDYTSHLEGLLYNMIIRHCEKIVANWDIVETYTPLYVYRHFIYTTSPYLKAEDFLDAVKHNLRAIKVPLAGRFEVRNPNNGVIYTPSSTVSHLADTTFVIEAIKEQVYEYWEKVFTDENELFTHFILGTNSFLYSDSISNPHIKPISLDSMLNPDDDNEKWREALTLYCLMDARQKQTNDTWCVLKGRRIIPLSHTILFKPGLYYPPLTHFVYTPFVAIHWFNLFYKNKDEIRKLLFCEEMKR